MGHFRTLLFATLLAGSGLGVANVERTEQMYFDIEFDGKRLGQHEFQVSYESDGAIAVSSKAEMRYRLAFVTLFRYEHSATEQWRNGCLTAISSTTNDDGERYALEGKRQPDGFLVEHRLPEPERTRIEDDCPASFAYWRPELLQRPALLNAQTGRQEPVRVQRTGQRLLDDTPTEHWIIETEQEGTIELWYRASDQRWLRLQHTSEDGVLLYKRKDS